MSFERFSGKEAAAAAATAADSVNARVVDMAAWDLLGGGCAWCLSQSLAFNSLPHDEHNMSSGWMDEWMGRCSCWFGWLVHGRDK